MWLNDRQALPELKKSVRRGSLRRRSDRIKGEVRSGLQAKESDGRERAIRVKSGDVSSNRVVRDCVAIA